jgi:hypothetical protein
MGTGATQAIAYSSSCVIFRTNEQHTNETMFRKRSGGVRCQRVASLMCCGVYCRHNLYGRGLMHHMSSGWDEAQNAAGNISMQFSGLLGLDKLIFRPGHYDHRHFQLPIGVSETANSGAHETRFNGCRPKLRRAHSHLLGEAIKLPRHRAWTKNLAQKQRPHQPGQEGRYGVA